LFPSGEHVVPGGGAFRVCPPPVNDLELHGGRCDQEQIVGIGPVGDFFWSD